MLPLQHSVWADADLSRSDPPATLTAKAASCATPLEPSVDTVFGTIDVLDDDMFARPSKPTNDQALDPLVLRGNAMVDYFAKINIFVCQHKSLDRDDPASIAECVPIGNSRSETTPFLFACG